MSGTTSPADVDEYIATFGTEHQAVLLRVREAIHRGMPGGQEKMRYGMPAVMVDGRYGLHFAGWKKHVGLYPVPPVSEALEAEITRYRRAKDSIGFRWSEPVPYDLIESIAAAVTVRDQ